MTLINQSDDENKSEFWIFPRSNIWPKLFLDAFENINFYSSLSQIIPKNSNNPPTQSVSSPAAIVAPTYARKKTPPPIPKRRQSHQSSISSNESNRNKPLKSGNFGPVYRIVIFIFSSLFNWCRFIKFRHTGCPEIWPTPINDTA